MPNNIQSMNFEDAPHLHQLQRDLWQWPKSRAALMVGAGFSLNARPLPGVTTRFPTWRELVRVMFDQMHPSFPGETSGAINARKEKFNRTNPCRIASEYEAAFGREKLNLAIREQNPDADFQPGDLHQNLLELPWADVFTTNYDTLLERTEIYSRNYQPVFKAEELPTSFSPRIVKLHGSFRSQTRFIISEEDYRTYPREFAPFVNTVQQALLENSFVLVGFSGDDPNFLAWTGWIRDELGTSHAPVYLVGPLFLGNADRLLLHRRGVTPIDLAPCFPHLHQDHIHEASTDWFLRCLAAAKPPRRDRWPEFDEKLTTVPAAIPPVIGASERIPEGVGAAKPLRRDRSPDFNESLTTVPAGLPPIIVQSERIPEGVGRSPELQKPVSNEVVSKLFKRWEFERRHYPGWIILPGNKRSTVHGMDRRIEERWDLSNSGFAVCFAASCR